jgi:hypothetical protein
MPAIDLASGTGSTTLITGVAGEIWRARGTLIPTGTGEVALLSGSTEVFHVEVGVAGGQYAFDVASNAAGEALSIVRTGIMALGGDWQRVR